jgi:hypothetical protein
MIFNNSELKHNYSLLYHILNPKILGIQHWSLSERFILHHPPQDCVQVGGKNLRMTDKLLHSPEVEGVHLLVLQRSLQECVGIIGLDGRVHIHFLNCASRF